jgi:hypothetical protein
VNLLTGRITDVIYQGDSVLLQLALPGGTRISVRDLPRSTAATPGVDTDVTIGVSAEHTVLLAHAET